MANQAVTDALRAIRFALTEDDFPFFNRHPHNSNTHTIAMFSETDVLDLLDKAIEEAER